MKYIKIRKKKKQENISINIYLFQKKKARGLKRAVYKIEKWQRENSFLDINSFQLNKKHHLKLSFSPFFNIFKNKKPPLWYQRILMKSIYETYKTWFYELSKTERKFYIKLWILKDDIMSSRIVVALDEEIENFPSFYKENPISKKNSLNSFFDKFPFLDTMFIIPLLHLSNINSIKDDMKVREIKKISKISLEILEEEDKSLTFIYPIDTILLCSL